MHYLGEEEQRRRLIELVKEKEGADCPGLSVDYIEKALGDKVTVLYWCTAEDAENDEPPGLLDLTAEEAESIGVDMTAYGDPETGGF